MPAFYEFFAGGGMARAGLGAGWRCAFANDFDPKKGAAYAANWGDVGLRVGDVGALTAVDLPGRADLAWASFPCQDLSLAGAGAGLRGDRSAAFWDFWRLMTTLGEDGRAPPMIALENVCGLMTSHGGRDFAAIAGAFDQAGYRFGAIVIDAALFLPQSRPRLFMLGLRKDAPRPAAAIDDGAAETPFRPAALRRAAPFLQAAVARAMTGKSTPRLSFQPDRSFDEAARIGAALRSDKVRQDIEQRDEDGEQAGEHGSAA